jgi:hypothetical protein
MALNKSEPYYARMLMAEKNNLFSIFCVLEKRKKTSFFFSHATYISVELSPQDNRAW